MEEKMFNELVQSIKEAGQIRRSRMNQKLAEKLQELEEEYNVELMTVEDVQEFLQSDLELMKEDFTKEIEWSKKHSNLVVADPMEAFLYGMKQGLQIAKTRYQMRIDEGF